MAIKPYKKITPMMRTMIAGSLLIILITGCGLPYRGTRYTDSALFTIYEPEIENGKTTEQEIRAWFGEPWMVSTDLQRRPQLTYLFRGGQLRLDVVIKDGLVYDHVVIRHGGEGDVKGRGEIKR